MRRLWLIFAQSVTVALAVLFVVSLFHPEWIKQRVAQTAQPELPAQQTQQRPIAEPTPLTAAEGRASYSAAAQKALPAIVHIFTTQEVRAPRHPLMNDPFFRHFFGDQFQEPQQKRSGLGSGVLVSKDGYILTNNHVIESADQIEIALNDGQKLSAHVVGRDPDSDLAVLKVSSKKELPVIAFADSTDLKVGDVALAIGNPFGVGQTVTMGIVSALGRSQLGINTFENFIQTDAAINPGNSGGALIDTNGRLVGINTAIYSRSGGSLGIGFAIPATFARDVMEQIIKNGTVTRGWIGVQVQEITPDIAEAFKLPRQGALIAGIARNSPADKGGLLPGDVLLSIDGTPVSNAQGVLESVASRPPGQLARLQIQRRGKNLEAVVQIGRRPPMATNIE